MTTRCAVLGSPIAHSLSPTLHRAAYDVLGLDWTYDAVEITQDRLPAFLDGLGPEWRGLSLTMPLKRTVVPLVDELDDWARLSGAANTVLLGGGRRVGANTDVPGAMAAVRERAPGADLASAVVLGGGATAASTLLALAELGCRRATLLVRDEARAEETLAVCRRHPAAPDLRVAPLDGTAPIAADVVVSTVPAGVQTPALLARLADVPLVFEVVYDPWPTPLMTDVRAGGRTLVTGLDLLLAQAVAQVRLMTGRDDVPVGAMRRAGEDALAGD